MSVSISTQADLFTFAINHHRSLHYSSTISIMSPANGAKIARNTNVKIAATTTDNVGVTKVEFYVNNLLKCTSTTSPYSCTWKVPTKSKVTYTLSVKAYDNAGNSSSSKITVTSQ